MSSASALAASPRLGLFERYLSLWVALCMAAGIALGHVSPTAFAAVARLEWAHVNLVVAVLVWLMIVPMLLKVDFGALDVVRQHWPQPSPHQPEYRTHEAAQSSRS